MEKTLDILLGEALGCLNEAAGLVRDIPELEDKPNLSDLGKAIAHAWEVRNRVHTQWPELKPDFVKEYEVDKGK